jgi:hypothetical protein
MDNAREMTIRKFTNLLNGKVYNASVATIIEYYEAQLRNVPITVKQDCSITRKFKETELELTEEDYWDGDESNNFLQ